MLAGFKNGTILLYNIFSVTMASCNNYNGTYTADNGSRPPWFALKTCCFDKNLIIETNDNQGEEKKYVIDESGKIKCQLIFNLLYKAVKDKVSDTTLMSQRTEAGKTKNKNSHCIKNQTSEIFKSGI